MHNIDESPPRQQRETPGQLRQWAADRLRVEILEGRLTAGEWLRQEKLARGLGVSQTPVREALKQLAAEGIVEHVPYRGVRVVSFTPDDVEDFYTSRVCTEGRAARFAAQQITKRELDELRELHRRMAACETPRELAAYRDLNRQFHLAIIRASRRTYLVRSLTQLWTAFPTMLWGIIPGVASESVPGRDDPDTAEHEEIIAALAAHDPARSERAMQGHIESAARALVSAMRAGR
ncbi:MAG: GntR family transcriptional regulator [Acidobacteria bacterium]|jgi:DNA-binding GntR family transcriptional regulator|nr:GntR family transcriptional regulator [Acidobacteriota bacterium]